MPLHLEDHLDAARVEGSDVPATMPPSVEWRFDQPQPVWKATPNWNPPFGSPTLTQTADALRVTLTPELRGPEAQGTLRGTIRVDVPAWIRSDWAQVVVRARAERASSVDVVGFGFNLREGRGTGNPARPPFEFMGQQSPVVRDGAVRTYQFRVGVLSPEFRGPWRQLIVFFGSAGEPGAIDLLSVSVTPIAASFADSPHGTRPVTINTASRRALFMHAPGRIAYPIRIPQRARLDVALGVLSVDSAVTFGISVAAPNSRSETLFEERHADANQWLERSLDLSKFAGQTVTVTLEARADRAGAVALWAAPTLSGARQTDKPNVILYVIDGGGADYMSVYGYNRRTTPTLERLASEGVLFEHAYSNADWTKPSTASFMTSLHNSVLGNVTRVAVDPLPANALTMAERFHRAGYQTAVFTPNPNALTVSGLERGADLAPGFANIDDATSSVDLHRTFWNWRRSFPAEPYWVHVQTTDVHAVSNSRLAMRSGVPVPPTAGLFVSPQDVSLLQEWSRRLREAGGSRAEALAKTGINRVALVALLQGMYDQQMAHNDHQLARFIDQLESAGEWARTILIVTADHSIASALADMPIEMLDPAPPRSVGPMFRPSQSRVPLLVVWPGRLRGGQRFHDPVSLIDLLPTVLDLAGLPPPDVMQGQSLAPLMRGTGGWTRKPIVLEEVDDRRNNGELSGRLEVVDGRWGASMAIGTPYLNPGVIGGPPLEPPRWHVMVYDLWVDPICIHPINEQRPDLVKKYTRFLEDAWKDHQALATRFTPGARTALAPEQLERLRSLGYIR